MIEQGMVMLVQANAAVAAICPAGGFLINLPKGTMLPSWTYVAAGGHSDVMLSGTTGFTMRRYQIDCYGDTGAQVLGLANAISNALTGFRGHLPDPDSTLVDSVLSDEPVDFFGDASRTSRRMIEFEIWFYQN